jgi:glycine cleavage system H protein
MQAGELRYTPDHYWVAREGALAVVGITRQAQQALGDITYVELPPVGRKVRRQELVGVIESIKTATEMTTPVAGKVVAVNEALATTPEWINQDPQGRGWLFKLADVADAEWAPLLTATAYEARECDRQG